MYALQRSEGDDCKRNTRHLVLWRETWNVTFSGFLPAQEYEKKVGVGLGWDGTAVTPLELINELKHHLSIPVEWLPPVQWLAEQVSNYFICGKVLHYTYPHSFCCVIFSTKMVVTITVASLLCTFHCRFIKDWCVCIFDSIHVSGICSGVKVAAFAG